MSSPQKTTTTTSVRASAMDFLARREHTRVELVRKLRLKGFSEEEIIPALDLLAQQGLLSDQRFAEQYCRMRSQRGLGPRRIQQELQERGVDAQLIDETMSEYSTEDWRERAQNVWEKKFAGKKPHDYQSWAKQRRFLQYRGFTDEQSEWLSL